MQNNKNEKDSQRTEFHNEINVRSKPLDQQSAMTASLQRTEIRDGKEPTILGSCSVRVLLMIRVLFCSGSEYFLKIRFVSMRPQSVRTTIWTFFVINISVRDGKETEPSKNEPNQNPGFAKNRTEPNRTEPNPKVKKICKNPIRTEPYPVKNRTESEPKCRGSCPNPTNLTELELDTDLISHKLIIYCCCD